MDADLGSNGMQSCIDREAESTAAERNSMAPGDNAIAIARNLQCCLCSQLIDDPMLLQCLHSCCRRCLKNPSPTNESSEVAAVDKPRTLSVIGLSSAPTSPSTSSVVCQTCKETTSVTAAVDNVFLAGKVKVLKVLRDMTTCAFCRDEQDVHAALNASPLWCGTCQKTMCVDCVPGHHKFHETHTTTPLHEMQCSDQAIGASAVSCIKHGRPYELACFTCETANCLSCSADCIPARHDVLLLSDPRFAPRFAQLKLKVAELSSSVSSKSAVLQQHIDMAQRLQAARQADLDQLKANKMLVIDAIDQAFQIAEVALKDGYDTLEAKALKLRRDAEPQLEWVQNTVDYSQQLLAAENAFVALMQQQKLVVSKLQSLLKMLDSTPSTRDASAFFTVPKCTEGTAMQGANSCLPKPELKTGDLCIDLTKQLKSSKVVVSSPVVAATRNVTWPGTLRRDFPQ